MQPNNLKHKPLVWLLLIVVVFLLLGGGMWWWFNQSDTTTIGPDLTLTRVVMSGEKTTAAYVSIPYLRDTTDYAYLNIAVDLNRDGKITAYTANGKTQEEWVVQNLPARVLADEGMNANFLLSDLTAENRQDFPVTVVLTTELLNDWKGQFIKKSARQKIVVSQIISDEISERVQLDPNTLGSTGSGKIAIATPSNFIPPSVPPTSSVKNNASSSGDGQPAGQPAKEKTVPTLAKEFNIFHSDVPDMDQKLNECVPTSAANSLRWLAKENKFTDKLPLSNTELLGELKDDMKWEAGGVIVEDNFLSGKDAFVNRHKLPIVTHVVGSKQFDVNILAKIALELQKGQDVEIDLEYGVFKADGSYERVGGHMVTVVGVLGTRDSQYVDIHDPLSPGPGKLDRYKVDGAHLIDYLYQGSTVTYIRLAFAESPTVPPSEPPIDSTIPPDGTSIVPNLSEIIGKFITLGQDNGNGELSVTITPTKIYDNKITKLVFDLKELKELPTSASLDINSNNPTDWSCSLSGTEYTCAGTTPLQENTDSLIGLFLDKPLSFCPPSIDVAVYASDTFLTTVQLERN